MRLYKTTCLCDNDDDKYEPSEMIAFDGTQAKAKKQREALRLDGMRNIVTVEVDVPTDKAGLMAYLNELISRGAV